MLGPRALRLVALATGTAGGLSGAAYGLLNGQSRYARYVIGPPDGGPLCADGYHLPDGTGPVPPAELPPHGTPVEFAVLGDSTAAGLGVDFPDELPGVRLARGLAAELERPVHLRTYAMIGTTSRQLGAQVDAALPTRPRVTLILVGANDVTSRLSTLDSAALLRNAVARLVEDNVAVVVGTCPDLGAIRPIPQPLRSLARALSLKLGRAQRQAVEAGGGYAVPLADLLAPEFLTRPTEFFSKDRFHPSAAGYEAATTVLLPTMCAAIGEWHGAPPPTPQPKSTAAEARRPTSRLISRLNRLLWRRTDA